MHTHTHAHAHIQPHAHACMSAYTHTHTHSCMHALAVIYQSRWTEEKVFRKVFREDLKDLTEVFKKRKVSKEDLTELTGAE